MDELRNWFIVPVIIWSVSALGMLFCLFERNEEEALKTFNILWKVFLFSTLVIMVFRSILEPTH